MATINRNTNQGAVERPQGEQESRQGREQGLAQRERGVSTWGGWDPFSLMREMMGVDPFRPMAPILGNRAFMPHFEVRETGNAFIFTADLPGVKEDDLNISLDNNRLTISGTRDEEQRQEDDRYFAYERSYGSFSRQFVLPEGIDVDNIDADLKDGVLKLTVPKTAQQQPRKISLKGVKDSVKQALGGKSPKDEKH